MILQKIKLASIALVVTLWLLSSCNAVADKNQQDEKIANDTELLSSGDSAAVVQDLIQDPSTPPIPLPKNDGSVAQPDWDKKIIKNATLKLELKNFKKYNEQLRQTVKDLGGYIANEEQWQNDEQIENAVVLKIPVDQFEKAMSVLPGMETTIVEKRITAEDVTGEYVDVKTRLATRKQLLNKYYDFLKQAKTMEEMLQVQKEINEIQENIESAAGRVNYLNHAASYSTINLSYYQYLNGDASKWKDRGFLNDLKKALLNGCYLVGKLLVAFITVWPLWIVAAFIFFLYKRFKRKLIHTP
jgi:hypothetical protein